MKNIPNTKVELVTTIPGKISDLDHSWPDNIDHQKPELSLCCLAVYVNWNLPGEMWSISTAFAISQSGF